MNALLLQCSLLFPDRPGSIEDTCLLIYTRYTRYKCHFSGRKIQSERMFLPYTVLFTFPLLVSSLGGEDLAPYIECHEGNYRLGDEYVS